MNIDHTKQFEMITVRLLAFWDRDYKYTKK